MIIQAEIEHLASLARIKLTPEEKESLRTEVESIIGYVDELKKAHVALDAQGRVGTVKNVMRSDIPSPCAESVRERLLSEAPDREGDFIAVKKIIS